MRHLPLEEKPFEAQGKRDWKMGEEEARLNV
jgi:hypothetical protein